MARDGTATDQADLIVRNVKVTTLPGERAVAEAFAARGRGSRGGGPARPAPSPAVVAWLWLSDRMLVRMKSSATFVLGPDRPRAPGWEPTCTVPGHRCATH